MFIKTYITSRVTIWKAILMNLWNLSNYIKPIKIGMQEAGASRHRLSQCMASPRSGWGWGDFSLVGGGGLCEPVVPVLERLGSPVVSRGRPYFGVTWLTGGFQTSLFSVVARFLTYLENGFTCRVVQYLLRGERNNFCSFLSMSILFS